MHLLTVIGIPVYLHYCGGELEEISYILKSNSCCGEEEDESAMDSGCCQDESLVVRSENDYLLTKYSDLKPVYSCFTFFFVNVPFLSAAIHNAAHEAVHVEDTSPPPDLLHTSIIESTFLRI